MFYFYDDIFYEILGLLWLLPFIALGITGAISVLYLARHRVARVARQSVSSGSTRGIERARGERPESDVIIVGSGVLGSALATVLARDGRHVTIIERDLQEPVKIIGELLQPGGCRALKQLGLEDCTLGIDAHTIMGYVVHNMGKDASVNISYPLDVGGGRAFHYGRFVLALRKAAMSEPNVDYVEGDAYKLLENNGIVVGVKYRQKDTEIAMEVLAPLTVVADGQFSRLRKGLVNVKPVVKSHVVGLLMRHCPQYIANHAEIIMSEPSPVIVYQISSTHTRAIVHIHSDRMSSNIKAHLRDDVLPHLPKHLQEPFADSIVDGPIRSMSNSFLPSAPISKRGVLCLGDALNMGHPITGGGMSVALNDAVMFRSLLRDIPDLQDLDAVANAIRTLYIRRISSHSFVVNVLSMTLYELISSDNEHLRCLKDACFDYMKCGGQCISGPVALLSILDPRPLLLTRHMFLISLYSVYFVFRTEPIWSVHRSLYRSCTILRKAFGIVFPLFWSELKTSIKF